MNPFVRNILGVVVGTAIGMVVNMSIIMVSGSIIPPPEGTDVTTVEGLKAAMDLMDPKHFLMPFLAHALGTFVGAFIAYKIAATNKMMLALLVGVVFLIGGLAMTFMVPAPTWFIMVDLILAYIPVAFIAGRMARKKKR